MTEGIVKGYWKEYYDFWDRFVGNWFKEREAGCKEPKDEISKAYKHAVDTLNFDELPTPYLGKPHAGVEAVILNMNPGLSETIGFGRFAGRNSDETQFYGNINSADDIGWLIRKFMDVAHGLYSSFVGIGSDINYSCLNPDLLNTAKYPDWVCGVNWWQGYDKKLIEKKYRNNQNRDKRMPWLRQIYNKDISPAEVFALELCPYHSTNFSFESRSLNDDDGKLVLEFVADNVIHPALMAVVEYKLPFAVAIGKPTAIFLEQLVGIGKYGIDAKLEKEWWDRSRIEGWPTTIGRDKKLRFTFRKYCLFAVKDNNGLLARFLVTAAPGGNTVPGKGFKENIEKNHIREYVRTNPLTREYYERIQPLKPMHWWKESKDKTISSKAKPNQKRPQQSKPASPLKQEKKQLYKSLWSDFSEWCKENNKAWFTEDVNYENNYIKPVGARKPCVLFKIDAHGQLYLGIYCAKNCGAKIRSICEEDFERINTDIDWGNQDNDKDITILFPFADDWHNPNEDLFNKMATTFESVRDVLRDKGFL